MLSVDAGCHYAECDAAALGNPTPFTRMTLSRIAKKLPLYAEHRKAECSDVSFCAIPHFWPHTQMLD
jgi:hypothetical protein